MKQLGILIRRNVKMFFKDKAMFFTSLISPLIILFLFITFLGNVYRDSFYMAISHAPITINVPKKIVEGFVGGWLMSSLLAVCTVTISFCANMQMVQDKVTNAINDFNVTPVSKSTLSLSYYLSTVLVTSIICYITLLVGFIYLSIVGWYLTVTDVLLCMLDVLLGVMFGTALSSIISYFLKTQGAISAVGTLVSSVYGFVCGAYMPISQFGSGIQTLISCLPGTYGTGLFRNHFLNGVLHEIEVNYFPVEEVNKIRDSFDCNIYFFDQLVSVNFMFTIMGITIFILTGIYVLMNILSRKK